MSTITTILGTDQATNSRSVINTNFSNLNTDKYQSGDSPTFATTYSPILIGGTSTTSSLTYKTTTGVGTTGADHIFLVGNNGATEAMRILNNANVGIGISPSYRLHVSGGPIVQTTSSSFAGWFSSTEDTASTTTFYLDKIRATPTNGDSNYMAFRLANSAGARVNTGYIAAQIDDITAGAINSRFIMGAYVASVAKEIVFTGTAFRTTVNDQSALGSATLSFSDLFLASGGVINWNNGDYTLTHASSVLHTSGALGIGATPTGSASRLYVVNSTHSSGAMAQFNTTQTTVNTSDTSDSAIGINYTLSASSASNELVVRGLSFSATNSLTGGGAISNMRVVNLSSATSASTTTTSLDMIYLESGTASGTVTTGRGLVITSLQGTTKYGIYDAVGTNWVNASGGTLNIGSVSATTSCIATFTSTTGAVLLPRMTTTQRDALTPLAGMVIYNTSTAKLNVYTTAWEAVTSV